MKRITKLTGMLFVAVIMTFAFSSESQATSGFARQTGFACTTCHFNTFPQLNAFGRSFKIGGYTMMGAQGKIEEDHLSIPDTLNLALVTKLRYSMTNGDTKAERDRGQFEVPDEAALIMGGRAGEHVGFLLENSLKPGTDGFTTFKVIFPYDLGGTTVGGGVFTSDGAGPSFGFELLNTGALGLQRGFGEGVAIPAYQYLGLNDKPSTGVVLYAANEMFFVNASLWGPGHGPDVSSGLNLGQYLRAAVTPNVGGWDLALGASLFMGETKLNEGTAATPDSYTPTTTCTAAAASTCTTTGTLVSAKAANPNGGIHVVNGTVIDAQALGQVGDMPLGVYLTYGVVPKTSATDGKIYDAGSAAGDMRAASIAGQLGVIPNRLLLNLAYRMGDNGATTNSKQNALVVGGTYKLAQNVKVQLDHAMFSGDDAKAENDTYDARTTLMLFSAF